MSRLSGKKVEFPKWTNREKRFIIFEMDEVKVFASSIFGTYFVCTVLGSNVFATMISIGLVTFVSTKAYKAFKEGQTKGALLQWLYQKNLWGVKEDPRKYSDCIMIEEKPVIPIGYERFFQD